MKKVGIKTLIIQDIIDLPDGNLVLAVNFSSSDLRNEYKKLDTSVVKRKLSESEYYCHVNGEKFKIPLLDLEVSSSLVNFKNIFLKIEATAETTGLKTLDEIHIDLAN